MNKILLYTGLMYLFASAVYAESKTRSDMENVAVNFATIMNSNIDYKASMENNRKQLSKASYEVDKGYRIVNLEPKGFVIVANDDRVDPVLGFSFEDSWDSSKPLPLALNNWLSSLEVSIKKIKSKDISDNSKLEKKWEKLSDIPEAFSENRLRAKSSNKKNDDVRIRKVGPLLQTNWSQSGEKSHLDNAYNAETPLIRVKIGNTKHAPVGCAATAFGQIMNYHRWPKGINNTTVWYKIDEYDPSIDDIRKGKSITEVLPKTVYHYSNHKHHYGADLTSQIGKTLGMRYKEEESIVAPSSKLGLLKDVFQYTSDGGVKILKKNDEKWDKLIEKDLTQGLPIMYQGFESSTSNIGHIFVCDGYLYLDSSEIKMRAYHFNWGWGGVKNMWTPLSSLAPDMDHIYTSRQQAVFGFRPNTQGLLPHAASNVEVSDFDMTGVTINWRDESDNEKGFKIYINGVLEYTVDANVNEFKIDAKELKRLKSKKKSSSKSKKTLTPDSTYTVVIKAYNDTGEYTLEDSSVAFKTGKVAKLTSFFLRKNNNDYFLIFLWNKHDADKVHLKAGYKKDGVFQETYYSNFVSGTTKEVKIVPSKITSVILSSYKDNVYMGSRKYDFSSPVHSSPIKPEAPIVRVVKKNLTSATLRLSSNAATKFKIYKDNHFVALASSSFSFTNYTVSNLEKDTEYTYKIVAINIFGESKPINFTFKTESLAKMVSPAEGSTLSSTSTFSIEKNYAYYVKIDLYDKNTNTLLFSGWVDDKKTFTFPANHGEEILAVVSSYDTRNNNHSMTFLGSKKYSYRMNAGFPPPSLSSFRILYDYGFGYLSAYTEWEEVNNGHEIIYYVYKNNDLSSLYRIEKSNKYLNLTYDELVGNSTYSYSLLAYDEVTKKWSNSLVATLPPTKGFQKAIFTLRNIPRLTSSTLNVEWKKYSATKVRLRLVENSTNKILHDENLTDTNTTLYVPPNGKYMTLLLTSYDDKNKERGQDSVLIAAKNGNEKIPNPPSDLKVLEVMQNKVDVTWTDNATNEIGFRIGIYKDDELQYYFNNIRANSERLIMTMGRLDSHTNYILKLYAYNKTGISEEVTVVFQVPSKPVSPTNLQAIDIQQTTATLIWIDNANNEIGYHLYRDAELLATLEANVTTYPLMDLTPDRNYTYGVKAYNNIGESVASMITFRTLIDSDNDGIIDTKELELGLNPHSSDSDNDGLSDLEEVGDIENPIDTDGDGIIDALDEDSDNDGFTDKEEVIAGTNPRDSNDKPAKINVDWLIPVLYLLDY